jgi:undecaprenyl-diphosphatase
MDAAILQQVLELRRPWLDDVMVGASAVGAGGFLWIVIGSIAGVFPRHTAAMWRLWLAVALAFVIVDELVKPFAVRPRPFDVMPIQLIDARPRTPSFPSGHAAMAAAGALAATRIFPSARWILWPVAVLIGVSRIYLGVHWPTDVVAGAALGMAVGWLVIGGPAPPKPRIHPLTSHF